jgi:hypothetical protein
MQIFLASVAFPEPPWFYDGQDNLSHSAQRRMQLLRLFVFCEARSNWQLANRSLKTEKVLL